MSERRTLHLFVGLRSSGHTLGILTVRQGMRLTPATRHVSLKGPMDIGTPPAGRARVYSSSCARLGVQVLIPPIVPPVDTGPRQLVRESFLDSRSRKVMNEVRISIHPGRMLLVVWIDRCRRDGSPTAPPPSPLERLRGHMSNSVATANFQVLIDRNAADRGAAQLRFP